MKIFLKQRVGGKGATSHFIRGESVSLRMLISHGDIGVGSWARQALILEAEMICALTIPHAGLGNRAKVESDLRSPSAFTSPPLRCVCHAAAPAAVCRVISVTSLAKQKLSPYKYGNLMIELSISWDKLKACKREKGC